MKNIIKLLRERDYVITNEWLGKNTAAEIDHEHEVIKINCFQLVVEAVVHEFLHYKYPLLQEDAIIAKTARKMNRASKADIQELVGILGMLMEVK